MFPNKTSALMGWQHPQDGTLERVTTELVSNSATATLTHNSYLGLRAAELLALRSQDLDQWPPDPLASSLIPTVTRSAFLVLRTWDFPPRSVQGLQVAIHPSLPCPVLGLAAMIAQAKPPNTTCPWGTCVYGLYLSRAPD